MEARKKEDSIVLAAALLYCHIFDVMDSWYDVMNRIFEYADLEARYVRKSGNRFYIEGPDEKKANKAVALIGKALPHPDITDRKVANMVIISVVNFLESLPYSLEQ
jgi:hypothetical protein